MSSEFDLAVIGSGFGGSLLAMIGRQLGLSVLLLERDRHPRFAIGESSTPLANLLLEEIARGYDLPRLLALTKWGSWQAAHPDVGCGRKRGFTFYHHALDQPWKNDAARADQLLVAASPHDGVADTHWYRPDFDHLLVRQAQELGAEFVDQIRLTDARFSSGGAELAGTREGRPLAFRARRVVDASGPRGFLHRTLELPEGRFAGYPGTETLFSHFREVRRWDDLHGSAEAPPYPVDDAAMHHVFEGGWIWVLRFNNGVTSAGVAAASSRARTLFSDGAAAWDRLLARLPSVQEQFQGASPVVPFRHQERLAFRSGVAAGPGWALLPSAAGFVDPLLSTGFPLTLLGVLRLAALLERPWDGGKAAEALDDYGRLTLAELDITAELVAALYANLGDFAVFSHLTLLYFAAAMYAETVRRLGRPEKAASFLLHADPGFGPALRRCLGRARKPLSGAARAEWIEEIHHAIEPFNLAGLGDPARRQWYPARANDLLAAAPKLGASQMEVEVLLKRCGFSSG